MVKASAYTLAEIAEKLKDTHSILREGKSEAYEAELRSAMEQLDSVLSKYPDDDEMKEYREAFTAFYEDRGVKEEKKLSEFILDIGHIVHWRKLALASGKELPMKDYRSLRGGRDQRG
ncbi:MAG: hypothetical protein V3T58_04530 [Candidatus Hydrothermarchaeales archaeon]